MHTPHSYRKRVRLWCFSITAGLVLAGCSSTGTRSTPREPTPPTHARDARRPADAAAAPRRPFGVTAEAPLQLPARIGIARIANGAIVDIPPGELHAWEFLHERFTPAMGELVPINRLVVGLAAPPPAGVNNGPAMIQHIVQRLRQSAARQRVDAVLIYEVAQETDTNATRWTLLDLTGVGALLGTSRSHAVAHASAVLVDVRTGAVCGAVTATSANETGAGPYPVFEEKLYDQRERVNVHATFNLLPQIEAVITRAGNSGEFADTRPFPEWRSEPPDPRSNETTATVSQPKPRPVRPPADEGAARDFWGR